MEKPSSPCYGCNARHVGCHAECVPYQEWKEEDLEFKTHIYNEKKKTSGADSIIIGRIMSSREFKARRKRK